MTNRTDEKLAELAQAGDKQAEEELTLRYWEKADIIGRAFPIPGMDIEDRHAIALSGLVRAVRRYQPGNGTMFKTFAKRLMLNALRDEHRTVFGVRRTAMRLAVHLEGEIESADGDLHTFGEFIPADNDTEEEALTAATADDLTARLMAAQQTVVKGLANGTTGEEMAEELGVHLTLVYSMIQNFRQLAMYLAPDLA